MDSDHPSLQEDTREYYYMEVIRGEYPHPEECCCTIASGPMPCLSKLWSWEQSDEEETIVLPPQHPIEEIDLQLDPQQESIENLMDENFTDIEDKGDKCNMIAGFCITHNRDIEDCVHLSIYLYIYI